LSENGAPAVSVVVATRDRSERLERALEAIAAQDVAGGFELIVVDDASRDDTADVLERSRQAWEHGPMRVIRRRVPGGPGGARNTGWQAADAPLVAFTDDDCEPQPGWLAALVAAARDAPDAIVQGVTVPHPAERESAGPFSRTLDVSALGPWYPTSNMAYPTELLERLGGFDPSLGRGEDTDLAWRALEAGAPAVLAPGGVVHHAVIELGPIGQLRLAARWTPAFANFARHPVLRRHLALGLFWKPSHAALLLAVLGAGVARRFPPALLLALPYLRDVRARMAADGAGLETAPFYPLVDAAETASAAVGSLRRGTFVL
jgi:GT2 family glycosyltransferase